GWERRQGVGGPWAQLATAVVLPQPAAPITTQIRPLAARSNSASIEGRSRCSARLCPPPTGPCAGIASGSAASLGGGMKATTTHQNLPRSSASSYGEDRAPPLPTGEPIAR